MAHGHTLHVIPLGTTEPQNFVLKDNGSPVDGTGWTVELQIVDHFEEAVATPPTVDWLVAADGTVTVDGVERLAEGMYHVRYKLADGSGNVGYVPNGDRVDLWRVVSP